MGEGHVQLGAFLSDLVFVPYAIAERETTLVILLHQAADVLFHFIILLLVDFLRNLNALRELLFRRKVRSGPALLEYRQEDVAVLGLLHPHLVLGYMGWLCSCQILEALRKEGAEGVLRDGVRFCDLILEP